MNNEFKSLTIGDMRRIVDTHNANVATAERVGYTDMEEVTDIVGMGNTGDYTDVFVDSIHRIAREILAERTSTEALKRAARVEKLDQADGVLPAPWYLSEHDGRVMSDGCIPKKEVGDIDFSAENEAAMLECRNVAPALAADVRAYDAVLRELVEALGDCDNGDTVAQSEAFRIHRLIDRYQEDMNAAWVNNDRASYDKAVMARDELWKVANDYQDEAARIRCRARDRLAAAIEAAKKVLNG